MTEMHGSLFIKSLAQIVRSEIPEQNKLSLLLDLLINICKEAVKNTGIQFHTLFSIIAYTGHQYNLPGRLLFNLHRFRREADRLQRLDSPPHQEVNLIYQLGLKICADLIHLLYQSLPPPEIIAKIPDAAIYKYREDKVVQFKRYQRVLVVEKDDDNELLIAIDQSVPEKKIKIRYNLSDRNELFNDSVELIGGLLKLPLEINLVDVEIDTEGFYLPRAFVIQPDFLIDITAVANCFGHNGIYEASYFIKRFLPVPANKHLMLGNIANYFLDELMARPNMTFKELIGNVFQINPLAFSLFDDATAREIVQKAQRHYVSLKMVVQSGFKKEGILIEHTFLEPTFYSEQYGLQGRLDVLYDNPEVEDDAAIVELKSGQPYRPNIYGLSHSHYVQTLLYDLLIKSASADRLKPTNYILYSAKETDHLRFAPAVRSQQYEAMAVRNKLIAIDFQIANADKILEHPERFLNFMREKAKGLSGYTLRDMELVLEKFTALTTLEKKYFLAMMAMVSREHRLAKIGIEGDNRNNGQAALWLNGLREKEDQFNILSNVRIHENRSSQAEPIIVFLRTEHTNTLANFRQGDLTIIYPSFVNRSPLSSQLFKGIIIRLSENLITIRLRAKQFNDTLFQSHELWNIEHDSLDSGFNMLYRSLFKWTSFDIPDRKRFLTLRPPAPPSPTNWLSDPELTVEQNKIMGKILSAQDYFLLWGPPGTGKTSIIVKKLMQYLIHQTGEQILLLAYTNRAVDELCHALTLGGIDDFLRIGSRYATHPDYVDKLLSHKAQGISHRHTLRKIIKKTRVVVGTISSVVGNGELFELKRFDRLIVDEATQVLEPMVAGLIPLFTKILLIGDHRQLAAVVTQSSDQLKVQDASLLSVGLTDLGSSYFERIFTRCQQEQWTWAFDKLSFQGRMHQDIMAFPSSHFYDGMLNVLPGKFDQRQTKALPFHDLPKNGLGAILAAQRVLFLPVTSAELFNSKINIAEANLVAEIVTHLVDLYKSNHLELKMDDIGIITPFRAQIAQIRAEIQKAGLDLNGLTIDTVERFQGGAKKIIIISLCMNSESQLANLISLSSDGVDRKLNVALTRAEEQVIVMGDPEILGKNATYQAFIEAYQKNVVEV
ncbi:MAG: AAA family ATPase [Saprospiraceae bacterium]|nr:AAA family ATPase [Saprospiraceae bacterium]